MFFWSIHETFSKMHDMLQIRLNKYNKIKIILRKYYSTCLYQSLAYARQILYHQGISSDHHTGYHTEYRKRRIIFVNNPWVKEEIRGKSRYISRQTKCKHNKLTLGYRRSAKGVSKVINTTLKRKYFKHLNSKLKVPEKAQRPNTAKIGRLQQQMYSMRITRKNIQLLNHLIYLMAFLQKACKCVHVRVCMCLRIHVQ